MKSVLASGLSSVLRTAGDKHGHELTNASEQDSKIKVGKSMKSIPQIFILRRPLISEPGKIGSLWKHR